MDRKLIRNQLLATTAFAAMCLPGFAAMAQEAAPAKSDTGIEEIVVTSTRVRTEAQKTPVALNVYSSDRLLSAGVTSVVQLQSIDPSVNISTSSGASSVAVRGVSSTDRTEIGDPSVPIATDGFFLNRPYTVANSFYDVNRVEVLKGPQGTLFGRNSTGGLINILTNRPTDTFGGYVNIDVGSYATANAEAALNIPLNDWAQLRISGQELHHDGYRALSGVNARGDDAGSQSGRIQLAVQPLEGLSALLVFQHDNVDETGDVTLNTPLGVKQSFNSQPNNFPYTLVPYNKIQDNRFRWEATYDRLPYGLSLIYAGGYDATNWHHLLEASGPAYPYAYRGFDQNEEPRTWNHEIRITTPQDWRVTFQAGYFHFQEDSSVDSQIDNNNQTLAGSFLPVSASVYTHQYGIHFIYPEVDSTSDGYFGQGNFKITPDLTFSAGYRYTVDHKVRTGFSYLNLPALASPFAQGQFSTPGGGFTNGDRPTYHLGMDWAVTGDNLVYAKYDTGYKSGGFNNNGAAPPVPYGPETLKTVELGTKNKFLDRHLQLNGDLFHSEYAGYQASQLGAALGNTAGVFNVGSATIDGAEAQVVALVDQIGRFDLNATYLDTAFGNNIIVYDGLSPALPHNIGGNRLPNAPRWAFSAGFEHTFELGSLGQLTGRIDGKYSSGYYFEVFNFADTKQASAFTGNLTASYTPPKGDWRFDLYVDNFTDAVTYSYATRNWNSDYNSYEFNPPRTFGARFNYNF